MRRPASHLLICANLDYSPRRCSHRERWKGFQIPLAGGVPSSGSVNGPPNQGPKLGEAEISNSPAKRVTSSKVFSVVEVTALGFFIVLEGNNFQSDNKTILRSE